MDGIFMKKITRNLLILILMVFILQVCILAADKVFLRENLIRLHIVAASDSPEDQSVKLLVRDAVVSYLQPKLEAVSDKAAAMELLSQEAAQLERIANDTLRRQGMEQTACVTVVRQCFDTRHYDTFSLPAGVYDSLRVQIGTGQGKNWWCVVFPSLCMPAAAETFNDTAVSAGFDEDLADSLSSQEKYELRFFFLDCLGRVENLLYFP